MFQLYYLCFVYTLCRCVEAVSVFLQCVWYEVVWLGGVYFRELVSACMTLCVCVCVFRVYLLRCVCLVALCGLYLHVCVAWMSMGCICGVFFKSVVGLGCACACVDVCVFIV